jgi:hypothetical protein
VQTRSFALAAAATLTALVTSITGCSANDEPADPSSTTSTAAAAPTSGAPTSGAGATSTSAAGETGANSQVISVMVSGGKVTPAPAPIDVKLGSSVAIVVLSDVADEVHVHGYDKSFDLEVGQPGQLELTANIPGQFEVELEAAHLLLFELRVS